MVVVISCWVRVVYSLCVVGMLMMCGCHYVLSMCWLFNMCCLCVDYLWFQVFVEYLLFRHYVLSRCWLFDCSHYLLSKMSFIQYVLTMCWLCVDVFTYWICADYSLCVGICWLSIICCLFVDYLLLSLFVEYLLVSCICCVRDLCCCYYLLSIGWLFVVCWLFALIIFVNIICW